MPTQGQSVQHDLSRRRLQREHAFRTAEGGVLTTLKSFNNADGQHPLGALIADASGTLYGTTYTGGHFGRGTVFDISDTGFVVFGTGAVPEPGTWAPMIAGFGIVGTAARRRRTALAAYHNRQCLLR